MASPNDSMLLCLPCLEGGKVRTAWTVAEGDAVCVRHAVTSFGIDDDMAEHDLFESVYQQLRRRGFDHSY